MHAHVDFNSSYGTYQYSYFSQSSKHPYTIAGVRSDDAKNIYYYTWPYLTFSQVKPVPVPTDSNISVVEEVHICDEEMAVYAVAKFNFTIGHQKLEWCWLIELLHHYYYYYYAILFG